MGVGRRVLVDLWDGAVDSPWWRYVTETAGSTESIVGLAQKVGMQAGEISNWRLGRRSPTARLAIQFARAYDGDVIRALTAAGFITPEEADRKTPRP